MHSWVYVKNYTLLIIAAFVWLIAGVNVLNLGVIAYRSLSNITWFHVLLSMVVFSMFGLMFRAMTKKHQQRVQAYVDRVAFWHFFDLKSYLIMLFMMTMGVSVRAFNIAPPVFIAVFYTGIGAALMAAGVLFAIGYFRLRAS